jgi:NAD(P)-dependent dehydrogenase (short-subunit alcohol dehydrogenase family)
MATSRSGAAELLRADLLAGVSILIAGARAGAAAADASFAAAVARGCAELGADVARCELPSPAADGAGEGPAARFATGAIDMLLVDCAGLLAQAVSGAPAAETDTPAGTSASQALHDCLEQSWSITRALVNDVFLPAERGGRIVYLAPPAARSAAGSARHADAARAGLENLARTLSIEWARHAITAVTIAPGEGTTASEVAALSAFLAAPAGAYFSGCLLDLRGPHG